MIGVALCDIGKASVCMLAIGKFAEELHVRNGSLDSWLDKEV